MEYFKNKKHTFEARIKREIYDDILKIGGLSYKDCINIVVSKEDNSANIPYIQSEPECSFSSIMDSGDTVDFIKASLQFVHAKYPDVTQFKLDDGSNIECGKRKTDIPPRKMEKPFSLAHLYIALKGETWYEYHFKARMINNDSYKKYRETIQILYKPINIEYDLFKRRNKINTTQDAILSQYYDINSSWIDFFNKIPKKDRCASLFNWLPEFINIILNGLYNPFMWYIDIDRMDKTTMIECGSRNYSRGGATRKYKKTSKFSNIFPKHGGIFDGNY